MTEEQRRHDRGSRRGKVHVRGGPETEGEQSPEDAKAKAGFPRESQEGVGPADTQQDFSPVMPIEETGFQGS